MKKSFDIDISTILCVNLNIKICQQKCYRAFEIVRIWFHAQQVLVSKLVGIQRTAGNCWFCHHQLRTLPAAHLAPRSNSIPKQRAVTTTTTTKQQQQQQQHLRRWWWWQHRLYSLPATDLARTSNSIQASSAVKTKNSPTHFPPKFKHFSFLSKKQFCVVPIWSGGRVVWYRSQIQTGFTLENTVCCPQPRF